MHVLKMVMVILLLSIQTWAAQVSGQVLNTIQDDEGLKVILSSDRQTHVLYLKNDHDDFLKNQKLLENRKLNKEKTKIKFYNQEINFIQSVE
jgi:hypothetical protein